MEVFHGVNEDVKTPMMHKQVSAVYFESSNFTGIMDMFGNGEDYMMLLLPDKGCSVSDVINNDEFLSLINGENANTMSMYITEITLPKFDVDCKYDIEKILPEMGVRSVFQLDSNAFSELTDSAMAVDKIEHACRLILDEEGVKAAAYTVETMYGGSPSERKTIVFDRPFIFIVLSGLKNVMFCGVINQL